MSGYADQVRDTIEQIPENEIFQASGIWQGALTSVPEKTYYKTLERLTKYGELMHLTKGLYYRPKKEDEQIIPMTDEEIVQYYTKDLSGMVIGDHLYVKSGIADIGDYTIEVLSSRTPDKQKHVGKVKVQQADVILNEDTMPVIEVLEVLQNYQKLAHPNRGRFLSFIRNFAEGYDEEATQYVIANRKYKKSTIAFLQSLLNWYGVENGLGQHLSTLSEYKIPRIEDLKQEIPGEIWDKLKLYVSELEKIYGEHLLNVILYGSYARGDFTEESDIDIMILSDLTDEELKEYGTILSYMTYDFNTDNELEIMPYVKEKEHYTKWIENYPFYSNIHREGVELYGAA